MDWCILLIHELFVESMFVHQFDMVPLLGHFSFSEEDDVMCFFHTAQSVRDEQHRPVLQLRQSAVHLRRRGREPKIRESPPKEPLIKGQASSYFTNLSDVWYK